MNIFIEEMVARKNTVVQTLMVFGVLAVSILLSLALVFFVMPLVPLQFTSMLILVVIVVFYCGYQLARSFNVEYEYSLVNTEMDVDKIINQKKRKRLTTVKITGLEAFGTIGENAGDYENYVKDIAVKKIFACEKKGTEDNFFVVYSEESVKTMLVFSPTEKIVNVIKRFNPRKA